MRSSAGATRRGSFARFHDETPMRCSGTRSVRLLMLLLAACTSPRAEPAVDSAAAAQPPGAPASSAAAVLTPAALRRLRWLEGSWRGVDASGAGGADDAFYERYRFADDSTLLIDAFRDSTFTVVTEQSRYELHAGRFEKAGVGARWVVVRLGDDGAVDFAPVRGARNAFTWRPLSADAWTAELRWPADPATPNGAARRRTYRMTRVAGPSAAR